MEIKDFLASLNFLVVIFVFLFIWSPDVFGCENNDDNSPNPGSPRRDLRWLLPTEQEICHVIIEVEKYSPRY